MRCGSAIKLKLQISHSHLCRGLSSSHLNDTIHTIQVYQPSVITLIKSKPVRSQLKWLYDHGQ